MNEYRITATLSAQSVEDAMERLLESFIEVAPQTGPVTSGNLDERTVSVTFSYELDSDDVVEAAIFGRKFFGPAAVAAGFEPEHLLKVEVESVTAEQAHEAELQLA